jgi:monothiol glutaredoxin
MIMNEELTIKIKELINSSKVFLFMKGTPAQPQCGFSMKVTETLKELGITFQSFDVLSNEDVRTAVKEYANWPTIPQLYVNGSFIGGCDIVLEMAQNGELKQLVEKSTN